MEEPERVQVCAEWKRSWGGGGTYNVGGKWGGGRLYYKGVKSTAPGGGAGSGFTS